MVGDMSQTKDSLEFSWLNRFSYQVERGTSKGEVVGYHKNGNLSFKYTLKNGSMHGVGRMWDKCGDLLVEETYNRGFLHGIRRKFHPNGQLKKQETYTRGFRHGITMAWDEKGDLLSKHLYVSGNPVRGEIDTIINTRELTAQDILKIGNAEVRRACVELKGYSWFLSKLDHEIIDRDGDCELVRINWHKKEEPIYLVKVRCPSTQVFYTLRVPLTIQTVEEAIAWTFGMSETDYMPEEES